MIHSKTNIIRTLLIIPIILLCFIMPGKSDTKPHGNEWINYSQQYYKITIYEEGIYRINYNTLADAGVPLGTFDPRNFQVFVKGEEQPIYVKNENTGVFEPGDYIEFYAKGNDGWFDRYLYENPENQPNRNYSLFTDTATYYITWNNKLNNKRFDIITDTNFSGYSPSPYFWHYSREDYTSHYFGGKTNNYGVPDPEYTSTQGWFDRAFNQGATRTKDIPTSNIYMEGPDAEIELTVVSASDDRSRNPNHHLQIEFADVQIDTLYKGYKLLQFDHIVPISSLSNSSTQFVFYSIDDLGATSRNTIAYISVKYPHKYTLDGSDSKLMNIPPSNEDKTFLSITDFNADEQDDIWIWDLTSNNKILIEKENQNFKALLPNPTNKRTCYMTSENNIKNVTSLTPVNQASANPGVFNNFTSSEYFNSDFIIITHKSLMEEARNYEEYRNSTGYNVLLADEEELYEQFSYGIRKHPKALRNFTKHLIDNYDESPRKLFLIGKAYKARDYRKNQTYFNNTMVPSFGNPPSDILITGGITDELYTPAIPTGRLSAREPSHVALYLDKIIQYEDAQQNAEKWMKNVLHFGGGSSESEQRILAGYLQQYQNTIEDTLMGAYVRTFLKSSTDPIEINRSDSLKRIINNGVSMMTFFGHAAGVGFDISIDNPAEYNNYGKYPFLLANSCFAGDLFERTGTSSSEEFVLIENKGTIGYLASTSASGSYELNQYSNKFFENISTKYYGKPVGISIKKAINSIQSTNIYIKNISLLKTLHGDPALKINSHPKPDYKITPENIYFTPKNVSTEMDSFKVNVVATNIGKAIKDSIFVELNRTFPDGTVDSSIKRISAPLYNDTISFDFEVDIEKGPGLNQFNAVLDAYNDIEELSTANNSANTSLMISTADIIPVYPYRYAIVPGQQVTLKASTGDPFADVSTYVFEVDTSPDFSNPYREKITQSGGVVKWDLPITLEDNTVYFWRVSPDAVNSEGYFWRSSSFQYVDGSRGWSQAHFDQFKDNTYQYIDYNPDDQQWDFINTILSIQAQTGIYPYIPWTEEWYKVDGVIKSQWSCTHDTGNGMKFAVFNPISGENWVSYDQGDGTGQFGNVHCHNRPMNGLDYFTHNETWRNRMVDLLDTVPEDYYVLAFSHRNHYAENYPEELYEGFESIGSANIRNLENNTPYIIFGKKGAPPGSANEVIGGDITSIIQLNDSIKTNWNEGFIKSELIGPAKKWNSIHWDQESLDEHDTDSVWLNVVGVDHLGRSDTLLYNIPPDSSSIYKLHEHIDAEKHPYLNLVVFMRDDSLHTPAQMRKWQVTYEGASETAINPHKHFVLESDTLNEGDQLLFSTAIHNIGDYDMDSLQVNYWIIDKDRQKHPVDYPRQASHPSGEKFIDSIKVDTRSLAGNNTLWMEVNPDNDQPEQYHHNNIGQLGFYVKKDKTNPLLDITFDGKHILDGDIVSANPMIQITLEDDNPYMLLDDTSYVKLYLQTPQQNEPERVYFIENGKENMEFIPAEDSKNQCQVKFNPELYKDGKYQLMVQAMDASMNESGKEDYSISFEVQNESTITEVLNWPNPFSTATHFVFTLTGSQIPSYFKIQIMTITGKVVKEIGMEELGPINIGRNITDYAWDGTDQYGQPLANGVYLYRVITKIDGENIELNPTEASKYFHEGFGKMYLIR